MNTCDEELFKKNNIEVVGVCFKCGQSWGTLEEYKLLTECQTCKSTLRNFCIPEDVVAAIRRLKIQHPTPIDAAQTSKTDSKVSAICSAGHREEASSKSDQLQSSCFPYACEDDGTGHCTKCKH